MFTACFKINGMESVSSHRLWKRKRKQSIKKKSLGEDAVEKKNYSSRSGRAENFNQDGKKRVSYKTFFFFF